MLKRSTLLRNSELFSITTPLFYSLIFYLFSTYLLTIAYIELVPARRLLTGAVLYRTQQADPCEGAVRAGAPRQEALQVRGKAGRRGEAPHTQSQQRPASRLAHVTRVLTQLLADLAVDLVSVVIINSPQNS